MKRATSRLRWKMEEMIAREEKDRSKQWDELPPEEQRRVRHELEVHELEVERQSEGLRRAQAKRAALRSRYFELYDLAPDGNVTRHQARQSSETSKEPSPDKPAPQKKLLLVEDDALIAMSEQMELERYGYHVVVAGTGEQAIEICSGETAFDLILMDIDLGASMSGPETATQILKSQQVPVLFLSSHTEPKVVAQTEMISSYGYVVKSSCITVLDASIKMALKLFQANVRLESEKEHLLTTLDTIDEAVIATDAAGCITRINPIAQNLTGWSLEESQGHPIQEVFIIANEQAGLEARNPVHTALASGKFGKRNRQSNLIAKNGTVRLIEDFAAPIKDKLGGIGGAVLVFRDITEESGVRKDLRESEEKFRTLFENANDAIFLMEGDLFIDCNAYALELFACQTRDQLVGHPPYEFSPALQPNSRDSHELAIALINEAMAGRSQFFEWTHKKLDGTLFSAEVSLNAVQLRGREILQAIVRDITERKKAKEALEKKTAEMERFTYTVSHDLKSPLVTIKTFLNYMEKDLGGEMSKRVSEDLGFIHGAADKMGLLLDELLKLARIGYNKNPHVEATFQEIVQEAMSLVAGQISERGVRVEVTQAPLWLFVDRVRLVEVFQNLLDNAVKFLGEQEHPRIEVGWDTVGEELGIFVRDNGQGIDPRHISKLFGLFEKLDPHMPGSGMGLAIVRRIVEAHGGKIRVASEGLGLGTIFWFTLAETQLRHSSFS